MSVKQVFNKNVDIQAYPVITGNFINAKMLQKKEVPLQLQKEKLKKKKKERSSFEMNSFKKNLKLVPDPHYAFGIIYCSCVQGYN